MHTTHHFSRGLTAIVATAALLGMAPTLTACGGTQSGTGSSQSQTTGDADVQKELKKLNALMDKAFVLKTSTDADTLGDPKTLTELDKVYKAIDPNKLDTVDKVKKTESKLSAAMKKVEESAKK
jgi:3-keto-L-gulonate-6-phosphate decarboxylase